MAASRPSSSGMKFAARRRIPNPEAAALLVIDMQNHFASIARPILQPLADTVRLCRDAGIPIVYTRHRHRSPEDYGMLGEWWGDDLILDGTPDSELMPEAGCRPGEDRVVEKSTYSAFQGTGLEKMLREEMGVEEVIVAGVMTNLCCETTARDAFVRGFRVFFSVDATATATKDMHEATLKNLAYGFTYMVDCERLKENLVVESK